MSSTYDNWYHDQYADASPLPGVDVETLSYWQSGMRSVAAFNKQERSETETRAPAAEPNSQDDRPFGTHIREAARILRHRR